MSERFVKAIPFKDVRKDDVVCSQADYPQEVSEAEAHPGYVILHLKKRTDGLPCGKLSGHPDEFIGLLHRPWPKRATERSMWAGIKLFMLLVLALRKTPLRLAPYLASLREAIEAYELGLRPEPEKKK